MTFLPIVERELRVQARQRRTYWLRLGNAGAAMALASFMMVVNAGFSTPGSLGHGLFSLLAWLAFSYCLLTGAGNTADCLSEEKREGTLGLLFLTDLKGYDVVLGKMLATSLSNFYGLMAIFPPLAITLCLGGVTMGEFWRLVLLLANTLFLSLALGMFVSALSRDEQRAWAGALALLCFVATIPVLAFLAVFDARYHRSPGVYWAGLGSVQGLGWVLLALASAILPRAWQDRPLAGRSAWVRWLQSSLPLGSEASRRGKKEELLLLNPVHWLAERQVGLANVYLWGVIALACGAGLFTAAVGLGTPSIMWGLFVCALGLHFLLASWVAFQASHVFSEARNSGTLELLLATPFPASQIVEGYFLGLKSALIRPIGFLLVVESAIVAGEAVFLVVQDPSQSPGVVVLLVTAAFGMVLFVTDLFAAGRFGFWMGLSSKKPAQAFFKTVLYVMVLPLFAGFCCTVATPLLALVKNAIFMNYAEEQLRRHFRTILTEGLGGKRDAGRLPPVIESSNGGSKMTGW